MEYKKPILVTGSHRSGSTWAGEILAKAPNTGYIHEPFNIDIKCSVFDNPFKYSFKFICNDNSSDIKPLLNDVIRFKYPLVSNIAKIHTSKHLAKVVRDQSLFWFHSIKNDTPIVKDPIAVFSAEWLANTFNMNVLVLIRHPAAFCSSLIKKNWRFNFNHFLDQPLLMREYLNVFEKEIQEFANNEKDILDQAILLWNCIHHTIYVYRQRHPEWLFVKHETLSAEPLKQFKAIYQAFELEMTTKATSAILKSSGGHNPTEQIAGNEFIRNSKANILNWKRRLSEEEIKKIRKATQEVSHLFYSDQEW
ncbi:sulfotransferase [Paraglaciecola aestuariivivens]